MLSMRIRAVTAAGALLTLAALAGCSGTAAPETDPAAQAKSAERFVACLTAKGVRAQANTNGYVFVWGEGLPEPGGPGDDEIVALMDDGNGDVWRAATSAEAFADDPTTQEAYADCEADHPEFAQPEFEADPGDDAQMAEDLARQQESALEFARCAREAGFTWLADPADGGIYLPNDITDGDFRALLTACWTAESSFSMGLDEDAGEPSFDWLAVWDEFQFGLGEGDQ